MWFSDPQHSKEKQEDKDASHDGPQKLGYFVPLTGPERKTNNLMFVPCDDLEPEPKTNNLRFVPV